MLKIRYILAIVILITGCSVSKIERTTDMSTVNENGSGLLFEKIKEQNLTSQSFFIQKAEIEISGKEGTEKLLGYIKFKKPDTYYISLKSKSGIEAAKIFISDDTIIINDRINRKMYCGTSRYLEEKYGITNAVLPVIFGDYINDNSVDEGNVKCLKGEKNIISVIGGVKLRYVIDCNKGKSVLAKGETSSGSDRIDIQYEDFIRKGRGLIPSKIEINDFQGKTTIKIAIRKIESPWDGSIEFNPGSRYEIIQLL